MNYYETYSKRMNDKYRNHISKKYAPFIGEIVKTAPVGGIIAEMGCGAGNISAAVAAARKDIRFHFLVDKDPRMLTLSIDNMLPVTNYFKTIQHDIRESIEFTSKVDLIHSHGVLEHFSDNDIQDIISIQLTTCKDLIHFVPSAKYEKPSFGDERLMTAMRWHKICGPDSIVEFNDGYDLMLIWRNSGLR